MLIDGKQKKNLRLIESLLTTFGWIYVISIIGQIIGSIVLWYFNIDFILSKLFIFPNIKDTIRVLGITFIIAITSLSILYLWSKYNKIKFGSLTRRTFPKDVDSDDLANYFEIEKELVSQLQNSKKIILEHNIV